MLFIGSFLLGLNYFSEILKKARKTRAFYDFTPKKRAGIIRLRS